MGIYFYSAPGQPQNRTGPKGPDATDPQPWRLVQVRHHKRSRALAEVLKTHMENSGADPEVRVAGAPLVPLEGVDMPAVLIELGHISNPATEQRMASAGTADALARALAKGINDFFQTQPANPR